MISSSEDVEELGGPRCPVRRLFLGIVLRQRLEVVCRFYVRRFCGDCGIKNEEQKDAISYFPSSLPARQPG